MTSPSLDHFLASVERRAYRMALLATRNSAEAMDVVQDAMLKLVQYYRHQRAEEWPLLFQRILQNRILDWHRQQTRRRRVFWWQSSASSDDEGDSAESIIDSTADHVDSDPATLLDRAGDINTVLRAMENLPVRQQQAFLLRAWEGFDVKTTAQVMACSEGSVKTHYFRAVNSLRQILEASHEPA